MYEFGECQLDPSRFLFRRDGRLIHLEPQVFDVLVYLIAHRDRVVTRNELVDAVWQDRFVGDSALTSRLKAARRAIGDDGRRQQLISTARGIGYRFEGDVREVADVADGFRIDRRPRPRQEIRYLRSPDQHRIAWAVSGEGPTIVKAGTWLTHLDLEWESPIWAHWIDGLSTGSRLVRYDERGCGLSDWDVDDIGFDAWVDALELVVDAAHASDFTLLGLSQGGPVAIAYAARHPDLVARLVLVGAYCRGRLARAETDQQREEVEIDLALGRVGWEREDPSYRQVFASQFLPDGDQRLWSAFNDLQRATTSTRNVVQFLSAFARIDVTDLAPRVKCPTLILHSRRDGRVPETQARELAALIPDSRLRFLDGRNHIVMGDDPAWPALLEEIRRFTTGPTAPSTGAT